MFSQVLPVGSGRGRQRGHDVHHDCHLLLLQEGGDPDEEEGGGGGRR